MSRKRNPDILVDPETGAILEDPKKPKIDLNASHKEKCLTIIRRGYDSFIVVLFASPDSMDVEGRPMVENKYYTNISIGNHIASIIFTLHNICRQKARDPNSKHNMETKSSATSFKVVYGGKESTIPHATALALWKKIVNEEGLKYENFAQGDSNNWYGTMGPYLDMFSGFALRMNELRLGHNNFPISKENGKHKSFPVSKYGLSGAHHVLLEGASFPPERRSSIVQSLGPMTVWLCMLRSEGIYRKKYAAAVKRAMAHIPGIDDIIEVTKNTKMASEISTLTTLLAEILLVTTARQATRMFFPLTIFATTITQKTTPGFNTTGRGGWLLYKRACDSGIQYSLNGKMEVEMAQQMVFHSIFGTFKEDLGILSAITARATWNTREEMGDSFIKPQGTYSPVSFDLIKVNLYSKMSCANQSGLLSGVYSQVATVPAFSGSRVQLFDQDFFDHIEKRKTIGSIGKTLPQIVANLTSVLEELHDGLRKNNGKIAMGTTLWKEMNSMTQIYYN